MTVIELAPGPVNQSEHLHHMDELVQHALDNPRAGDVFHEMYSYAVSVVAVGTDSVFTESTTKESRAFTREEWSQMFQYKTMPGKHFISLLRRGAVA